MKPLKSGGKGWFWRGEERHSRSGPCLLSIQAIPGAVYRVLLLQTLGCGPGAGSAGVERGSTQPAGQPCASPWAVGPAPGCWGLGADASPGAARLPPAATDIRAAFPERAAKLAKFLLVSLSLLWTQGRALRPLGSSTPSWGGSGGPGRASWNPGGWISGPLQTTPRADTRPCTRASLRRLIGERGNAKEREGEREKEKKYSQLNLSLMERAYNCN